MKPQEKRFKPTKSQIKLNNEAMIITRFILPPAEWNALMAKLSAPPKANPALKKLFSKPVNFTQATPRRAALISK